MYDFIPIIDEVNSKVLSKKTAVFCFLSHLFYLIRYFATKSLSIVSGRFDNPVS